MIRTLCAVTALVLLVGGCGSSGPKLYPVTGKVIVDGSPKGKLTVTFSPVKGGIGAVGVTNDKGEYTLSTNGRKGAAEGEYKVSITTIFDIVEPPKVDSKAPSGGDAYMNQANIRPQEFKRPKETIPEEYNTKSNLMRTITPEYTSFEFEIVTKK